MKISQHFDLREFLPPESYKQLRAQKLIDQRLPIIMERIRELCGGKAITINNWHIGGKFKYRGYRPPDCRVGAIKSMHKMGQAVDFDVDGMKAEEVRQVIRDNAEELYALGVRRMESGVSWVHIDLKPAVENNIYEFKP